MQPPDPLDEWKSPPFEPEVRGDDIFARGACDDKGQVYIQIKAVEGLLKTTGRLPVNVKFLLEGEEETGGEHIEAYVKTQPAAPAGRRRAWSAIPRCSRPSCPPSASDCAAWSTTSCTCEGANHDLHSGVYGGAAPNPMQAIAEIICALKDRNGHILIPGFYDRVVPPSDEGARGVGAPAVRREGVHRKGNGRARTGGRARRAAVRARVGAPHARGPRHSRRLHRRRREDRDPRARRRQDQHAPGGRSARR